MTIFLRALYGPFGRQIDERVARYGGHVIPATQIDWHFFGIREDDTVGRWAVRFSVQLRTWQTINFPMTQWAIGQPVVHKDAFVPDQPMIYGQTYLDILKPRLSKEDLAYASRLAIAAAR